MNESAAPLILVINPGSTSTKVALFNGANRGAGESLSHSKEELARFQTNWEQYDYRLDLIIQFLNRQNLKAFALTAVVGRGGLLKPLRRGTYKIGANMIEDARRGVQGDHISNLGCALAHEIARLYSCASYVVDPVSVDEFEPLARYSGHPRIERKALSHALNLRATAIWGAEAMGLDPFTTNLIVAHLGGGISIAPLRGSRIIDVNDASSDGPFSPERSGGLPLQPFIDLCFSGEYSKTEMKQFVMGRGGLAAYLGTKDAQEVESRIENGDAKAAEVYQAMAYQIAKEIAAMASVLNGQVHGIMITGGLAHSRHLIDWIKERVAFIAPVRIFAGELEMEAMAAGVLRVLSGQENACDY